MTADSLITPDATSRHKLINPPVLYFGTPVCLVSTLNSDGTPNLAPMSSAWFLGDSVVLGFGNGGQTIVNLTRERECVINLPSADQHEAVERIAPLTGRDPVPDYKASRFRFDPAKFEAAGLTPQTSEAVAAPRVLECPVQLEARVASIHESEDGGFSIVEARVLRIHVDEELVIPGSDYVNLARWNPLLYVFRHYFGLGADLGRNFRAEV